MRIAYITYWGVREGLSQATSIPHLEILNEFNEISGVDYYTFERAGDIGHQPEIGNKINHIPLYSSVGSYSFRKKISDYWNAWKIITTNHKKNKYDFIIARSSFAGIIAYLFYQLYKVPYSVESFEPHADYMADVDNGWSRTGIRYRLLKFAETLQKRTASILMPIAESYKTLLIKEGVPKEKIIVQPCCVDYNEIHLDLQKREEVRNELGIPSDHSVGIYAGKFGGLYYHHQAYEAMADIYFKAESKISYIILTPNTKEEVMKSLTALNIDPAHIHILFVPRDEVFKYLYASDFSFNFHMSTGVSCYLSPIKNSEYWAAGLPIFIPYGVGDDYITVSEMNVGVVHNYKERVSLEEVNSLKTIMNEPAHRARIRAVTQSFRSLENIRTTYAEMLSIIK